MHVVLSCFCCVLLTYCHHILMIKYVMDIPICSSYICTYLSTFIYVYLYNTHTYTIILYMYLPRYIGSCLTISWTYLYYNLVYIHRVIHLFILKFHWQLQLQVKHTYSIRNKCIPCMVCVSMYFMQIEFDNDINQFPILNMLLLEAYLIITT